jgi:hypothetical protein
MGNNLVVDEILPARLRMGNNLVVDEIKPACLRMGNNLVADETTVAILLTCLVYSKQECEIVTK